MRCKKITSAPNALWFKGKPALFKGKAGFSAMSIHTNWQTVKSLNNTRIDPRPHSRYPKGRAPGNSK